jgi:hypothetical protein
MAYTVMAALVPAEVIVAGERRVSRLAAGSDGPEREAGRQKRSNQDAVCDPHDLSPPKAPLVP